MEITYLKKLQNFPARGKHINRGMSEQQIDELEEKVRTTYYPDLEPENCRFPWAFRELLFLAGDNCYAVELTADTMWEQDVRIKTRLAETNTPFLRPFFVLENYDDSLIIFLDENKDDPDLYTMDFGWDKNSQQPTFKPLVKHNKTLTGLIKHRVTSYLETGG